MKTFKSVLFAFFGVCIFLSTTTAHANSVPVVSSNNSLKMEVQKLVQNPNLLNAGIETAEITVKFKVNSQSEIVVLGAKTNSDYIAKFVTSKLDHSKINTDEFIPDTVYSVKLSFELS